MTTPSKSIATKLTWMNLLVSATALLLACAAFLAYDQITFRQNLIHSVSVQAQIVGSNSVSALLFNDPQSASNTLSALRNLPNIDSAGILTLDRRPFATYTRPGGDQIQSFPVLPEGQDEAYRLGSTRLVLVRSIVMDGKAVGYVYIRSDLTEIDRRLRRYGAIALVVLLLSLGAALIVSALFRRSVALPIVQLAEVAQKVSQQKNYSVRATPSGDRDEVALLVEAFNNMLAQIESRDGELKQAHSELENRVAERTRELLVANRELEAFSYSVSHDLRGPVDAINGFTYVLQKEYAGKFDNKERELVEHIKSSGRRMMQLIDDLLNLSRVSSRAMQRESVDLSAMARSIAEELRHSEPKRDVEFVINDVDPVEGDPRLLTIVMENLLRNSWKYTSLHPKARIEFGSKERDGKTIYYVRDDGAGFDPRAAERLFQPFQRLHPAAEFPGNGVGLATVQRIVRRHGGDIWAEGQVEKGATFCFSLEATRMTIR